MTASELTSTLLLARLALPDPPTLLPILPELRSAQTFDEALALDPVSAAAGVESPSDLKESGRSHVASCVRVW